MNIACYHMGLSWLPILLALTMVATFLISYCVSVYNGHVNAELPLISSTGAYPPESCFFAQGLNLCAFIAAICIYILHRIVEQQTAYMGTEQPRCIITWMLVTGMMSALGLTFVGNFQQVTVEVMHDLGALTSFIGAIFYIFLVAHVCRKYLAYRSAFWGFRLFLGLMCIITLAVFIGCHIVSRRNFKGSREAALTSRYPGDGAYDEFVCASTAEWVLGMILVAFFLSLAPEFKKYAVQMPEIVESAYEKTDRF